MKIFDRIFVLFFVSSTFAIKKYIPLGEHVRFECEILKEIKKQEFYLENLRWSYSGFGHLEQFETHSLDKFVVENSSLTIYDVQEHDSGKYECHVNFKIDSEINETRQESSFFQLIVQNCGTKKDQSESINFLNPCKYGECQIRSWHNENGWEIKRLTCRCSEQFTGKFCDVPIPGTWIREFVFYSPIVGHFIAIALFFIGMKIWNFMDSKPRISLFHDVPNLGPKPRIPFETLYPSSIQEISREELHLSSQNDEETLRKVVTAVIKNKIPQI